MTNIGAFKPLPIGVDGFEDMISSGYYYVDKTLLIQDLLDLKGKVNLFTRPRRFGKTLNMTMLREFFQLPADETAAQKQRALFEGLKIMDAGGKYTSQMGRYPVVFISLKSGKQPTWDRAFYELQKVIAEEFRRHKAAVWALEMEPGEREIAERILNQKAEVKECQGALQLLSKYLEKAWGRKCVILIDEYDVPLENAYFSGFYEEMIGFVRSLFESALKTNESLAFAVMTGCLRISRESIFTGLNNLRNLSITSTKYAEHFGFTLEEVKTMLRVYGKARHLSTVRDWYDGYLFGEKEVYNPWSVLNFLEDTLASDRALPRPYWANTSSNSIVKTLVEKADIAARDELDILIAGGSIEKAIHEDITYDDVDKSQDNLWNFLYFTGYLRKVTERLEGNQVYMTLRIPNREVQSVYSRTIIQWFSEKLEQADLNILYEATLAGDGAVMEGEISRMLFESISYLDNREAYYHGFLAGLYKGMPRYLVESNRETGDGRPDLILRGASARQRVVVMEVKAAGTLPELVQSCDRAVEQIQEKKYCEGIRAAGYQDVVAYGISFYGKDCVVKGAK